MKYRRLGRTGLVVSVVGVGTWQLSGEWGRCFTQPGGKLRQLGVSLGGDDVDQARRVDQVGADVVQVGYNRLDCLHRSG
jgi:predicted aldo/keto reductase-like oxidoreductase